MMEVIELSWVNHKSNLSDVIYDLYMRDIFSDVTVACEGKYFTAHRLVLAAHSEYFREMLEMAPCQHPIIILKDVDGDDIEALFKFMYKGNVEIAPERLPFVLRAANDLKVKGLALFEEKMTEAQCTEDESESGSVSELPLEGSQNCNIKSEVEDGSIPEGTDFMMENEKHDECVTYGKLLPRRESETYNDDHSQNNEIPNDAVLRDCTNSSHSKDTTAIAQDSSDSHKKTINSYRTTSDSPEGSSTDLTVREMVKTIKLEKPDVPTSPKHNSNALEFSKSPLIVLEKCPQAIKMAERIKTSCGDVYPNRYNKEQESSQSTAGEANNTFSRSSWPHFLESEIEAPQSSRSYDPGKCCNEENCQHSYVSPQQENSARIPLKHYPEYHHSQRTYPPEFVDPEDPFGRHCPDNPKDVDCVPGRHVGAFEPCRRKRGRPWKRKKEEEWVIDGGGKRSADGAADGAQEHLQLRMIRKSVLDTLPADELQDVPVEVKIKEEINPPAGGNFDPFGGVDSIASGNPAEAAALNAVASYFHMQEQAQAEAQQNAMTMQDIKEEPPLIPELHFGWPVEGEGSDRLIPNDGPQCSTDGEEPQIYHCYECTYRTHILANLRRHRDIHRTDELFKCPHCPYTSNVKRNLSTHVRDHVKGKRYHCPTCSYSCYTLCRLREHMYTHNNAKPFRCPECDYGSNRRESLKEHLLKHLDVKPFECSECSYKTRVKRCLVQDAQLHSKTNSFECKETACGYKTNVQHVQLHSKTNSFECKETGCGYKTNVKCNLARHMVSHTKEKIYKCSQCPFQTNRKYSLGTHMELHAPVHMLRCSMCRFRSPSKAELREHYLGQHPEVSTVKKS